MEHAFPGFQPGDQRRTFEAYYKVKQPHSGDTAPHPRTPHPHPLDTSCSLKWKTEGIHGVEEALASRWPGSLSCGGEPWGQVPNAPGLAWRDPLDLLRVGFVVQEVWAWLPGTAMLQALGHTLSGKEVSCWEMWISNPRGRSEWWGAPLAGPEAGRGRGLQRRLGVSLRRTRWQCALCRRPVELRVSLCSF